MIKFTKKKYEDSVIESGQKRLITVNNQKKLKKLVMLKIYLTMIFKNKMEMNRFINHLN